MPPLNHARELGRAELNLTEQEVIDPSVDRAWWFHTTLDPHLSEQTARTWYRRLHRRIGALNLAVATQFAVSIVLGVKRPLTITDRNQLLAWLIDEPDVWVIQMGEMALLEDALEHGIPVVPVADIWRATGLPRSRLDDYTQDTLQRIVRAAVLDRLAKRTKSRRGVGRC